MTTENTTTVTIGKVEEYHFTEMQTVLVSSLERARSLHWNALLAVETEMLRLGLLDDRDRWALRRQERDRYWRGVVSK